MTDASFFTPQQASDPATPAELLGDIARDRPDLRSLVAANPSAYPALLEWLGSLGDPQVDAALAARGGAAPPPPLMPPNPSQPPPPVAPGAPPGGLPPPGSYPGTNNYGQSGPYPGAAAEQPPMGPGYGAPPSGAAGYAGAAGFAGAAGVPGGPGAPYGASPYGAPAGAPPKKGMSPAVIALVVAVPLLLIAGVVAAIIMLGGNSEPFEEYGSDPALDRLTDRCQDGDMGACDQLYFESPVGSEYEDFGDTCGYRQPSGTGELCD